ncbi:histidine utilization repressor [Pseudorhodoferax sp.]|uniref:histidine utilization repressor n=1 Tax=Pseudorhodoferax sp. TaxID=1993553 RepID=UPI0039E5CFE0
MTELGPAPAQNGEPAYLRVKRWVLEHIEKGRWKTGERLPSEAELVRLFGVSRMTVNRALRELTADQHIRRVQGLGSFVAEPKVAATVVAVQSIQEEIRARGHQHSCEVLKLEKMRRDAADVPLELPASSLLFHALVLHLENGMPIQLEDRYVNGRIAPEFMKQDFRTRALGDYLMQMAPISRARHVIEALAPSRQVASLLKLKAQEPCLVLTRFTWSDGLPATWARLYHPGSRYRFTAELGLQRR